MSTIYAVGDIHGELEKLRRLIRMITTDSDTRGGEKLGIFLGDYLRARFLRSTRFDRCLL